MTTASPVTLRSPLRWLAEGWADLKHKPAPGLANVLLLVGLGLLTGLLGLAVVLPLVGHASWHACRDLDVGTGRRTGG